MLKQFYITICFVLIFFVSCSDRKQEETASRTIATAGKANLTEDDLKERLINTGDPKDSVGLTSKAIEDWAMESLFYQEAIEKLRDDEMQIEKEVENYRRQLVSYIYQSKLVEANLDTVVSREEIQDYYEQNKESFILKDNIVKVNYVKVPLKAQGLDKIRKLLSASGQKEKDQLKGLCAQYADNFYMNDSTWLYLDDIKKEIPGLRDQADFNIFNGKVIELSDNTFFYHLRIKDIKVKNSLSPLNFERQNIRKFIVNRRKSQMIREYKNQLLEKARSEKTFRVGETNEK